MTRTLLAPLAHPEPIDGALRFVARSQHPDRDGDRLDIAAVDLADYRRCPVVLWGHDPSRLPIGRADVFIADGDLMADVIFDLDDPFAAEVERKYRSRYLFGVSIGYSVPVLNVGEDGVTPKPGQAWKLHEISACAIPRDSHALYRSDYDCRTGAAP